MKKNKKAIFGLAIAMIFSLSLMQGISTKQNQDINLSQVSIGASWVGGQCEDPGNKAAWNRCGDVCEDAFMISGAALFANQYASDTNPYGWGCWVACGICGL